jgi:hypothetical protein
MAGVIGYSSQVLRHNGKKIRITERVKNKSISETSYNDSSKF